MLNSTQMPGRPVHRIPPPAAHGPSLSCIAKPRKQPTSRGRCGGTTGGLPPNYGTSLRPLSNGRRGAVSPPPLSPAPRNKQSQLSAPEPAPGQVIEAPGLDLLPALRKAALANQSAAPHRHPQPASGPPSTLSITPSSTMEVTPPAPQKRLARLLPQGCFGCHGGGRGLSPRGWSRAG